MKNPVIITGLDIGSSRVSAVVAEIGKDATLSIRAEASLPSKGISRGAFANMDDAVDSVGRVLGKIREKLGVRPDNIYANVSGETVKAERSKGMIPLSMRGREITKGDMDRCVNVASTIQLPFDRDVIHKIVHSFSIDDQPSVKNPLGLYASRLACEMFVVTASVNHIQDLYKCVDGAGYDVKEIVYTGVADAMSLLTDAERKEGTVLLNIGASLTEVSIFSGGVMSDLGVILTGTEDLKGDFKSSDPFKRLISDIKAKIDDFMKRGDELSSVVLTGGFSFVDGAVELLEAQLFRPVRVGVVKHLQGQLSANDAMKLATALGLVRYGEEKYRTRLQRGKNLIEQISLKVTDLLNNYF